MPSPISPLNSYKPPTPTTPLSAKTFHIAGILTTVFGLAEIPADASEVVCLWLLHPRMDSQRDMAGLATRIVQDYYDRRSKTASHSRLTRGFIAVTFDARNHGTREIDPLANQAWKQGNENHAPDMFSVYSGTAQDVCALIDFLPAYIFPNSERSVSSHFALGVSLGGHSTWLCLLHEPRIRAGVIVVGAPDFTALMADRARLSKLSSWVQNDASTSGTAGSRFLGSQHFPTGLLETVQKRDPAAVLTGQIDASKKIEFIRTGMYTLPSDDQQSKEQTQAILDRHLRGKRIQCLSGGNDKLVPYRLFEPFMSWLKKVVEAPERDIYLEDLVFDNTAHELTEAMMQEALRFIYDAVLALDKENDVKISKI